MIQIFLSFAHDEDIEQVNGFRGMLENPNADINFIDGSCKKDYQGKTDKEIEEYIESLIEKASVTVCLISGDTRESYWVNRELEISGSMNKGIVGIILPGKDNEIRFTSDLPKIFQNEQHRVDVWSEPERMQELIEEAYMMR